MLSNPRFFSRIFLPSMAAVLLFLIAIYFIVIPNFRESLMEGKRETIRELSNTAWSVMSKLNLMINEDFDINKAQNEAIIIIRDMRYGPELKDYFWITDTFPHMIMHPYRPSLNGTDLTDYQDPRGKNFFVDIVNLVKENGDGYIDYKWQWKDDSLTVVPKLSYVKAFEPWGWIVGTGIYIEDVNKEISRLTSTVVWISALITLVIASLIIYLARRNYVAELERQKTQELLRDSMERYKKLVEASTDGVLMVMDNEIVYCNPYLINLLGYSQQEFDQRNNEVYNTLGKFIQTSNNLIQTNKIDESNEISIEQKLQKKNGPIVDVIVNQSKLDIGGKRSVIYTIKDISKHKDVERELDLSMEKFKSIAGIMNLGIFRCNLGRNSRFIEINQKTLDLLGYSTQEELKETHLQDIIEVSDERKDVIRAISEGIHVREKLLQLKRTDGTVLPALVSLFPVNDSHGKPAYCDGIIIDAYSHLHKGKSFENRISSIQLSANIFLKPLRDFLRPIPYCDIDTTVGSASKMMAISNSSIILILREDSTPFGVLTHGDISRRVVSKGLDLSTKVSEIMSAPAISVNENEMVLDALNLMLKHRIKHIIVKQGNDLKYSCIDLLSLSELRKKTPEFLISSISKSQSVFETEQLVNHLPGLVDNLIETGTAVKIAVKLISKISDTITEKLIVDALNDLGTPPAPFVFIVLGSEGRREQTLATDQDNAIIYLSDSSNEEICKDYFQKLGSKICIPLSKVGYPLCKGGVMAMNGDWCKGIDEWKRTISEWVTTPNPQEVLNTSIFFDFRPIYGNFEIADNLQEFCLQLLRDKNLYFFNLAKSIINLKPPQIDIHSITGYEIKLPILAITSIVRLWSLKYGINDRNTTERLLSLESMGVFSSILREEFDHALQNLMLLRIRNQIRQINTHDIPTNTIITKHLSERDKSLLKRSLTIISDHMSRLTIEFRIS